MFLILEKEKCITFFTFVCLLTVCLLPSPLSLPLWLYPNTLLQSNQKHHFSLPLHTWLMLDHLKLFTCPALQTSPTTSPLHFSSYLSSLAVCTWLRPTNPPSYPPEGRKPPWWCCGQTGMTRASSAAWWTMASEKKSCRTLPWWLKRSLRWSALRWVPRWTQQVIGLIYSRGVSSGASKQSPPTSVPVLERQVLLLPLELPFVSSRV